jgi:hypothetical protein
MTAGGGLTDCGFFPQSYPLDGNTRSFAVDTDLDIACNGSDILGAVVKRIDKGNTTIAKQAMSGLQQGCNTGLATRAWHNGSLTLPPLRPLGLLVFPMLVCCILSGGCLHVGVLGQRVVVELL